MRGAQEPGDSVSSPAMTVPIAAAGRGVNHDIRAAPPRTWRTGRSKSEPSYRLKGAMRLPKITIGVLTALVAVPSLASAHRPSAITIARATALATEDFRFAAETAPATSGSDTGVVQQEDECTAAACSEAPSRLSVRCHRASGTWFDCSAEAADVDGVRGWERDSGELGQGGCEWYEGGWGAARATQPRLHLGAAALDSGSRKQWGCPIEDGGSSVWQVHDALWQGIGPMWPWRPTAGSPADPFRAAQAAPTSL